MKTKEELKDYQKAWRERNKEKIKKHIKEYGKNWFQENKERLVEVRRKWREENPEKARAYSLKSYYKHQEKNDNRAKERDAMFPEKRKAVTKIMHLLQEGKIEKPEKCPQCSSSCYRMEAHHPDYSKPTEIIWLCAKCHRRLHERLKKDSKKI
jgi:hypothetical protein